MVYPPLPFYIFFILKPLEYTKEKCLKLDATGFSFALISCPQNSEVSAAKTIHEFPSMVFFFNTSSRY